MKEKTELKVWQEFYSFHFGMDCDFSQVHIPKKPEGEWLLIIMAFVSLEKIYARCEKLFPCWRWTRNDFDQIITWNERDAQNGVYAIWVKNVRKAEGELKDNSAYNIKFQSLPTETLAERLIHELKFFEVTDKHLDATNSCTLCCGSRYNYEDVPCVRWNGGKMRVDWFGLYDASRTVRPRRIIC